MLEAGPSVVGMSPMQEVLFSQIPSSLVSDSWGSDCLPKTHLLPTDTGFLLAGSSHLLYGFYCESKRTSGSVLEASECVKEAGYKINRTIQSLLCISEWLLKKKVGKL